MPNQWEPVLPGGCHNPTSSKFDSPLCRAPLSPTMAPSSQRRSKPEKAGDHFEVPNAGTPELPSEVTGRRIYSAMCVCPNPRKFVGPLPAPIRPPDDGPVARPVPHFWVEDNLLAGQASYVRIRRPMSNNLTHLLVDTYESARARGKVKPAEYFSTENYQVLQELVDTYEHCGMEAPAELVDLKAELRAQMTRKDDRHKSSDLRCTVLAAEFVVSKKDSNVYMREAVPGASAPKLKALDARCHALYGVGLSRLLAPVFVAQSTAARPVWEVTEKLDEEFHKAQPEVPFKNDFGVWYGEALHPDAMSSADGKTHVLNSVLMRHATAALKARGSATAAEGDSKPAAKDDVDGGDSISSFDSEDSEFRPVSGRKHPPPVAKVVKPKRSRAEKGPPGPGTVFQFGGTVLQTPQAGYVRADGEVLGQSATAKRRRVRIGSSSDDSDADSGGTTYATPARAQPSDSAPLMGPAPTPASKKPAPKQAPKSLFPDLDALFAGQADAATAGAATGAGKR